jgi:transcriptional regulator with XRE-family HTH domain
LRPSPHPAKGLLVMAGITQSDLARQIGKSEHWIWQVLNGLVPVPIELQEQIATLLDRPRELCFQQPEPVAGGVA